MDIVGKAFIFNIFELCTLGLSSCMPVGCLPLIGVPVGFLGEGGVPVGGPVGVLGRVGVPGEVLKGESGKVLTKEMLAKTFLWFLG